MGACPLRVFSLETLLIARVESMLPRITETDNAREKHRNNRYPLVRNISKTSTSLSFYYQSFRLKQGLKEVKLDKQRGIKGGNMAI